MNYNNMRILISIYKCKNISNKMLKDVGMTVPKVEKQGQYIGSNTGDEGMQQQ